MTKEQIRLFKTAVKNNEINLLFFDIETKYMLARIWRLGKNYIDHKQLVEGTESKIISIQYHNNFGKTKFLQWEKVGQNKFDDKKMLIKFVNDVVNGADIIIGQNAIDFDKKTVQERLKIHKLPAFKADFMLDTLILSRSTFNTPSHKLDYRSAQQRLGGKHRMEMSDWVDVVERGVPATKKMIPYGIKDDEDTAKIFWAELPYYNFPRAVITRILQLLVNRTGYLDKSKCMKCQRRRQGKYNLKTIRKAGLEYFECLNCSDVWES